MMLPFDRIYFDSNPLIAAGWPRLSAELENILLLARMFKVALFLPQAVELELEEHWLREFDKKREDATSRVEKLKKYATDIVTDDATLTLPDHSRARDDYCAKVQALKEKWAIGTAPLTLTLCPLDEIFRMAIRRNPPFQEEGKGFPDAVILLSIIDHLRDTSEQAGAFISRNGDFKEQEVTKLAASFGVQVRLYKTLDEISRVLKEQLRGVIKSAWEKERQCTTEVLNTMLPQIERFITENLEIPSWQLWLLGTLIKITRVEILGIKDVQTPLQKADGKPVKISFTVEVNLHAVVERFPVSIPPTLKVSQEASPPPTPTVGDLLTVLQGPKREEEILRRSVEVEATAVFSEGEYKDIQFLSVRLK